MSSDPDLQLVIRCQSGDISAFNDLIHRHKDRIYRLIYRMLRDIEPVDDIAQEVFLKAYSNIHKFQRKASFSTWLTKITINQCISRLRSRKRLRLFSTELFSGQHQDHLPDKIYESVEKAEKYSKVHQAIDQLSPKRKAVIILYYLEDRPCEEMADILNCSIGTVKSRLFHARKELKKRLEPYIKNGDWLDSRSEIGGEGYEVLKM